MGLDFVELILRTEEVFSIDLPDEDCELIRTVGDLYKLILEKMDLPYVPSSEIEVQPLGRARPLNRALQLSPWTAPDVWLTLKQVIHDQLGIKPSRILESATFLDDLGCD
jgi:acyl carrier protein